LKAEFLKVVTASQNIIHKVCRIYRDNQEDREDLFQDILVELWRSYPSFRGDSLPSTWVYRIALSTAIAKYRKKKNLVRYRSLSQTEFDIPDAVTEDRYEEQKKMFYEALEKCDNVEKALVLLYLDDHSYKEMSVILGISESNIGVKLNRVKNVLRENFKKQLWS
jgi:RNA polymerase sigma factor (sigma-70 family)